MSLILFVHYAVGSSVANHFAALAARDDRVALDKFARDAAHWTFWPSLAAGCALLALGLPLLWLFGPQFTSGYPVMLILVVGFLFRASMGPTEFLLNMMGTFGALGSQWFVGAFADWRKGLGYTGREQWDPMFNVYIIVLLIGSLTWLAYRKRPLE